MDDEILPNSRAPDLKLGSPEPTYVNTQMIHRDDQSLSPIYDDASTPLDNTTGEHVYATLCCENPMSALAMKDMAPQSVTTLQR